jgi:hypothetical protein
LQEVNLLVKAIKEFGFGSWAKMKSKYKFSTPDRTEMQLKDKGRNLLKSGKYTVSFFQLTVLCRYLFTEFVAVSRQWQKVWSQRYQ